MNVEIVEMWPRNSFSGNICSNFRFFAVGLEMTTVNDALAHKRLVMKVSKTCRGSYLDLELEHFFKPLEFHLAKKVLCLKGLHIIYSLLNSTYKRYRRAVYPIIRVFTYSIFNTYLPVSYFSF